MDRAVHESAVSPSVQIQASGSNTLKRVGCYTVLSFAIIHVILGLTDRAWMVRAQSTRGVAEQTSTASNSRTELPNGYVGKDVCAECHKANAKLHGESGHESTFRLATDSEITDRFANRRVDAGPPYGLYAYVATDDEFRVLNYRGSGDFELRAEGGESESISQHPFSFALGSGHNAITLLTLDADDDGNSAGIEHRVSWFAPDKNFGSTPGHQPGMPTDPREWFGQIARGSALERCVDCHTTSGTVVGDQIVDLVANVNCERCHGPGSDHVRHARQSETPPAFSVGHPDWDRESELQLCGDCHRLPRHVDPIELRDYTTVMLRFQPIGMVRSKCYLESETMRCTTCHNPHAHFKSKTEDQYVQDCIGCHRPGVTNHVVCPESTTEGCVECHMPARKVEQNMVFHDHWIRIQP